MTKTAKPAKTGRKAKTEWFARYENIAARAAAAKRRLDAMVSDFRWTGKYERP